MQGFRFAPPRPVFHRPFGAFPAFCLPGVAPPAVLFRPFGAFPAFCLPGVAPPAVFRRPFGAFPAFRLPGVAPPAVLFRPFGAFQPNSSKDFGMIHGMIYKLRNQRAAAPLPSRGKATGRRPQVGNGVGGGVCNSFAASPGKGGGYASPEGAAEHSRG